MYELVDLTGSSVGNRAVTIKRITANISEDLLSKAVHFTGLGYTETIHEALEVLVAKYSAEKAAEWKGKLILNLDQGRKDNEASDR